MSNPEVEQAVRDTGAAVGEAGGIFMLHPETFGRVTR
jgi:hypothetical protein